jgi:hypothetical protein
MTVRNIRMDMGEFKVWNYKQTSSKCKGGSRNSTGIYEVITGADEHIFPSSPIPKMVSHGSANWKDEHVLLQLPFTVVEWTHISSFEPTRDAMEVERVL